MISMPPRQTALQLLQLIALMLPAVAIYLDIIYPDFPSNVSPSNMSDGEAANFHATRLTFLLLLISGVLLLIEVLWTPQGLEQIIVKLAILVLAGALITFTLPVLFNIDGLKDKRGILWPYKNLWHRIQDRFL